MSGEAGGAILGIAAVVALAPVVLTAAAVGAVGYGLIRGGIALARHSARKAQERQARHELFVSECSADLSRTYDNMERIAQSQAASFQNLAGQMSDRMQTLGSELQKITSDHSHREMIDAGISGVTKQVSKTMTAGFQQLHDEMRQESSRQLAACTATLDASLEEQEELVRWADKTEAGLQMQKAAAAQLIRDAEASVRLIQSLSQRSGEPRFRQEALAVESALAKAKNAFSSGAYQAAFSSARSVIRQCAILSSEHVQRELEADALAAEAQMKLEALHAEMEKARLLVFRNESREDMREEHADLNQFTQGAYVRLMGEIDGKIKSLTPEQVGNMSIYELTELIKWVDDELTPRVRKTIESAGKNVKLYYEKLYALRVIQEYMYEQNYTVGWVAPAGGDPCQEIVVNFRNDITGESVSVTLDADAQAGDIVGMALNIYSYTNGQEASEEKREEFREKLMAALQEAGFTGRLSCTGSEGKSSQKTVYQRKDEVLRLPVEQRLDTEQPQS